MNDSERIVYLEKCLHDAGYHETQYGWHNGERFVGIVPDRSSWVMFDEGERDAAWSPKKPRP